MPIIFINNIYYYKVNRNNEINIIYKNYWQKLNDAIVNYNLNIDKSIRLKESTLLSKLLNECTFYYFKFDKIYHFNLKYIPRIFRKIFTKIYG